jgi:predicted nucleotidyltransferase
VIDIQEGFRKNILLMQRTKNAKSVDRVVDEKLKSEIIEQLRPLDPYKVVLFGSYAWGEPDENSDVDLYIVSKEDHMPQNFAEKMRVKAAFSKAVRNLRKKVPVDLIVHTMAMHRRFVEHDSVFSKELMKRGVVLYEEGN